RGCRRFLDLDDRDGLGGGSVVVTWVAEPAGPQGLRPQLRFLGKVAHRPQREPRRAMPVESDDAKCAGRLDALAPFRTAAAHAVVQRQALVDLLSLRLQGR